LLILWFGAALASPVYPSTLTDFVGAPCAPTCSVCHSTPAGGVGTAVQPFAVALIDGGLTGGSDTATLDTALGAMDAAGTDSDGDGIADLDELGAGDDPNGGEPFCDVLTPTYGCLNQANTAPSGLAVLLGMLVLVWRRTAFR